MGLATLIIFKTTTLTNGTIFSRIAVGTIDLDQFRPIFFLIRLKVSGVTCI